MTEPAIPPLRILVVDDDREVAEVLQEILEDEGHAVSVAHDGKTALALAAASVHDLALLDFGLPDMDGIALAGHLRASPATAGIRLIALTGSEETERAAAAGFERLLLKPISLGTLLSALGPQPAR